MWYNSGALELAAPPPQGALVGKKSALLRPNKAVEATAARTASR